MSCGYVKISHPFAFGERSGTRAARLCNPTSYLIEVGEHLALERRAGFQNDKEEVRSRAKSAGRAFGLYLLTAMGDFNEHPAWVDRDRGTPETEAA